MERISTHISYEEAIFSSTAIKHGIDNTPNEEQIENMKLLAANIYEPLVEWEGCLIFISSFFRSKRLNIKIGGSASSAHCAIGDVSAIDFDGDVFKGKSNSELFNFIKDNLEFDTLIWEFGDDDQPNWVHVSFRKCLNKGLVLRAFRTKNGVKYVKIN